MTRRISVATPFGARRKRQELLCSLALWSALLLVSARAFSPPLHQANQHHQQDVITTKLRASLVDEMMEKADSMNPLTDENNRRRRFLEEAAVDCEVADGVPPVFREQRQQQGSNTLVHLAVAGAVATAIGDGAMHPLDCIKTLQQSDAGYGLSLLQAARLLHEQAGWPGFYGGFFTYAVSDAVGGSLKFVTFELGKRWTLDNSNNRAFLEDASDQQEEEGNNNMQQSLSLFACAAVAFVASSFVVVPGELLKQQLQMNLYEGLPEAIAGTLERDGLGGFYTGYSGVFLRDIPYTMLELGLYDLFKNGLVNYKQQKLVESKGGVVTEEEETSLITAPVLSTMEEIMAAALTGGIAGYLTTPFDTIKTKVMVDQQLYDGFLDCLQSTIDQHGLMALFAGGAARVAWLVPFTAIYLPVYDFLKRKLASMAVTDPAASVTIIETDA